MTWRRMGLINDDDHRPPQSKNPLSLYILNCIIINVGAFAANKSLEKQHVWGIFVHRCCNGADTAMGDIDILIVTHCVPGQQGVKQPIKKLHNFAPVHPVNNNVCSQIRKFMANSHISGSY